MNDKVNKLMVRKSNSPHLVLITFKKTAKFKNKNLLQFVKELMNNTNQKLTKK